jgi:phage/plasmid primase-like uncharacterized protein
MTAATMAAELGGARREGRQWRCRCPLHGGRSLLLRNGRDGRLLVFCMAGCDQIEVLKELRRLRLGGFAEYAPREDGEASDRAERQQFIAKRIWETAIPGERSPQIKHYLASRGIVLVPPSALRWVARIWHSTTPRTGIQYPATIAKIVNVDDQQVALHKTYLLPGRSGKVSGVQAKEYLGPVAGAAVRLETTGPEKPLIIGEGIETVLSLMQLRGLPGWAALSAPGLRALALPENLRRIVIAVDNDRNGVGQDAALEAACRWQTEGRAVRIAMPPEGEDFNDVLIRGEGE